MSNPRLAVPQQQARDMLKARIDQGSTLLAAIETTASRGSRRDHDELEGQFIRWDRYNETLLGQLFDDGDTLERYERSKPVMRVATISDYFQSLRKRLQGALTELHATVDIIELLETSEQQPPAASTPAERDEYFAALCRQSGGRTDVSIDSREVAAAIGMSGLARRDVEEFLRAEGLIEFVAFGPRVQLTHAGRRRYEQGKSAGTSPSATSQTVIVEGDMTGGTIQQAGAGSSQNVSLTSDEALEQAREWVEELLARVAEGTLAFTSPLQQELDDQVELVQSEFAKPEPKRSVVRASLRSLARILEEAGGDLVATGLLQGVPIIVHGLS